MGNLIMFKGDEEHLIATMIDGDGQAWYAAEDVNEILGIDNEQMEDSLTYRDLDYMEDVLSMKFDGVYDLCLHNKANECEELLDVLCRFENMMAEERIYGR